MSDIIGGEFNIQISEIKRNIKKVNENLFSSGRSAFCTILRNISFDVPRKILLPDYLCSSITQVCIDESIPYDFYHINDDLFPDDRSLFEAVEDNSIVLLISYFGIIDNKPVIEKIKKIKPESIIILDDVQNFYANESDNTSWDYRFTSYRKWFPVPDGAEIFCKGTVLKYFDKENQFAEYKFAGNLLKNYSDWISDDFCLDLIKEGERILDENYNCMCSSISKQLIPQISYEEIKEKRKENSQFLHNELEKLGIRHLYNSSAVPLFIPIFINIRDKLRNNMFENNIFTPIHWPYESKELNGLIRNTIYNNELSLICDQRYSLEDMKKQIGIIKKCI